MDAFDADVLILAAVEEHPLGRRVLPLLLDDSPRVGSVLLLPEVLSKPLRDVGERSDEFSSLVWLLARLDLRPVDAAVAELATSLAARYRLRAADAVHLATAVSTGADRFITNNRNDFPADLVDVTVVYPDQLPAS